MQVNPTQAIREPCEFCGEQHDEMECFRNEVNEERMFDQCYEIASETRERKEVWSSPDELVEAYFDHDLKPQEIQSVRDIAKKALIDAKRDW